MANSSAQLTRSMRKIESKKSHSWWWDSHISPKNSKWLAENLEEMDRRVKKMLKLIEEDADSFAKKAEMYYKKRPELITQVEELYRMYRSLAERYDHLTGELRKDMSSDIQSQGSGISEIGSDLPYSCPFPDQRPSPRKSGPRAAGFDVFLASGGNSSDVHPKGDKSSSSTDSESESDDYSVSSGNEGDQGESGKMAELEIELHEMKEKLRMLEEENTERAAKNDNSDLLARIREYEEEMKIANERIQLSEEKITSLKIELQKYEQLSTTLSESLIEESAEMSKPDRIEVNQALELQNKISVLKKENQHVDSKMQALLEELSVTKEMLEGSEKENASLKLEKKQFYEKIQNLQCQLDTAQREIVELKLELAERSSCMEILNEDLETSKFECSRLKIEVNQALELQNKISVLEKEKQHVDNKLQALLEELSITKEMLEGSEKENASLKLHEKQFYDKIQDLQCQLDTAQREIVELKLELAEKSSCMEILNEDLETSRLESRRLKIEVNQALEIQNKIGVLEKEKQHVDSKLQALLEELSITKEMLEGSEKENASLKLHEKQFYEKIQDLQCQLDTVQREIAELKLELVESSSCIKVLNEDLETSKSERNVLKSKMYSLEAKLRSREVRIVQMDMHLHQLHMEHVKLLAKAEGAQKLEEELQSKVKELEDEIEKQRVTILEGEESKREAIRQLCFSLEHYRNGYQTLRQAFIGHKRIPVLTT